MGIGVSEDALIHLLEKRDLESLERLRALLREEGRPDLVVELDNKLKDIRLGLDGARGTWHALSKVQREALKAAKHTPLGRGDITRFWYYAGLQPGRYGLKTVRNLVARELLACDGGTFDPEKRLVITERGRFVLKWGPSGV